MSRQGNPLTPYNNKQPYSGGPTKSLISRLLGAVRDIFGLDYWLTFSPHRFNLTKHLKYTCQFTGALALTAFATYSLSNWFHWRSYSIAMPWNFFGSHLHTVALIAITSISSWYMMYGVGSTALYELSAYQHYISQKYLGNEYGAV